MSGGSSWFLWIREWERVFRLPSVYFIRRDANAERYGPHLAQV